MRLFLRACQAACLALILLFTNVWTGYSQIESFNFVTNGQVRSILRSGNRLYVGGTFALIGPNTPYGIGVNSTTGTYSTGYAKPNSTVRASVPDGSGG
ncbi:MAG: hypothetical protein EOP52_00875 [Sphingobacteriales bacterium]|nr:MAG: hypothetical protein EOP52_00875 [Sphingobacteriales bacterium]